MNEIQAYLGLDDHKATMSVTVAEAGRGGEVRSWGTTPHKTTAINRLVNKLQRKHGVIERVYEARPCGYSLQRHLACRNVACRIVAPSKVPDQPGQKRRKNDTHDGLNRARFHRACDLIYIWVPAAIHGAMQDLVRERQISRVDKLAMQLCWTRAAICIFRLRVADRTRYIVDAGLSERCRVTLEIERVAP